MKKLFLSFAVLAGLSMISCANKEAAAEAEATDSVEVETVEVVDTLVNDSVPADTAVVVAEGVEVAE